MSRAVESLITPSEAVPPSNLPESADGACPFPARTLAGMADDLEAACAEAGGSDPGTARLRAAVQASLPFLRSPAMRLASATAAFLDPMVSPEFEPRAAPEAPEHGLGSAASALDPDARPPIGAIENDILHRALTGWIAALCALQLSMEDNHVPPAAFDAVLFEMVHWRDLVGSAITPEDRTAY